MSVLLCQYSQLHPVAFRVLGIKIYNYAIAYTLLEIEIDSLTLEGITMICYNISPYSSNIPTI